MSGGWRIPPTTARRGPRLSGSRPITTTPRISLRSWAAPPGHCVCRLACGQLRGRLCRVLACFLDHPRMAIGSGSGLHQVRRPLRLARRYVRDLHASDGTGYGRWGRGRIARDQLGQCDRRSTTPEVSHLRRGCIHHVGTGFRSRILSSTSPSLCGRRSHRRDAAVHEALMMSAMHPIGDGPDRVH